MHCKIIVHPPKGPASRNHLLASFLLLSLLSAPQAPARAAAAGSKGPGRVKAGTTSALSTAAIPQPSVPPVVAQAGFGPLDPTPPKDLTTAQIIEKFGEREAAFARARNQYTYRQTVKVDTISTYFHANAPASRRLP